MKHLLCAFLWLLPFGLLCEPVRAEAFNHETFVPACWEQAPGSKYWHPCVVQVFIDKGYIEQRHLAWMDAAQDATMNNSCLATMQEAMMLMDMVRPMYAYTRGLNEGMLAIAETTIGSPSEKVRAGIARFEKTLQPIMETWDAAKACWKGKP